MVSAQSYKVFKTFILYSSSQAVSAGPLGPQSLSIGRPNRAYTSGSKGWGGRSQVVGVEGEVGCPWLGLESRSWREGRGLAG